MPRCAWLQRIIIFLAGLQLLRSTVGFVTCGSPWFSTARHPPVDAIGRRWNLRCAGLTCRVKAGDELNGFQLEEALGEGSFGTTWRARATNQSDLQGLSLQEGPGRAGRLRHPAIPRYYGSVLRERVDGQDLGLVSALVQGTTLEVAVTSGASLEMKKALGSNGGEYQTIGGDASFAPPVVHRDIKPANILLEFDSQGRLSDNVTQGYAEKVIKYGVGASLLFAATGLEPGSLPVDRLEALEQRWAAASHGVGSCHMNPEEAWLPSLLRRLLAPAPEDRFTSASEALRFLEDPAPAPAPSVGRSEARSNSGCWELALVSLDPPRGSKITVKEDAGELLGLFATAWTTFTAVWTAGVVSAGKVNGKQLDSGKTAKLQCFLEGPEMGQVYLVLQEGIERPLKQGGLTQTEGEWLENLISSYISGGKPLELP
eukprot:Skav218825  [mRNA]  locus=scaffold2959:27900:39233:+ [translate_table: standard]